MGVEQIHLHSTLQMKLYPQMNVAGEEEAADGCSMMEWLQCTLQ